LLAASPQLAKLVVFTIKLHVHITFFEVKQGHAIFFTSAFSLVFFEIISFWDKHLLPPSECCAALANNAGQIALSIKLAFRLGKSAGPNLLPSSGHNFWHSPHSLWGSGGLPLPRCLAATA
jgi:hypothetical protein